MTGSTHDAHRAVVEQVQIAAETDDVHLLGVSEIARNVIEGEADIRPPGSLQFVVLDDEGRIRKLADVTAVIEMQVTGHYVFDVIGLEANFGKLRRNSVILGHLEAEALGQRSPPSLGIGDCLVVVPGVDDDLGLTPGLPAIGRLGEERRTGVRLRVRVVVRVVGRQDQRVPHRVRKPGLHRICGGRVLVRALVVGVEEAAGNSLDVVPRSASVHRARGHDRIGPVGHLDVERQRREVGRAVRPDGHPRVGGPEVAGKRRINGSRPTGVQRDGDLGPAVASIRREPDSDSVGASV